jgi:hypothetical protein
MLYELLQRNGRKSSGEISKNHQSGLAKFLKTNFIFLYKEYL